MILLLALAAVIAVVLYRIAMIVALAAVNDNTIRSNWSIFISMTGACLNLILILIFNYFYEIIAIWLTEKELRRTQAEFDDALTIKMYLLQFVNYYGSIFYIAFIKGQFIGRPDDYARFLGFRQDYCLLSKDCYNLISFLRFIRTLSRVFKFLNPCFLA